MYDSTKLYIYSMDNIAIGHMCIPRWSHLNSIDITWKSKVGVLVFTTRSELLITGMLLKLVLHDTTFTPHFLDSHEMEYITQLSTKSSHIKILTT